MARTAAGLPAGTRLTDYLSLGVLTARFPIDDVQEALLSTGRVSERVRDLPAHVMVYAIALALYAEVSTRDVLRCLLEGARWLGDPEAHAEPAGWSGISQARTRLGAEPLEALYRRRVAPVATATTPDAWYREWRIMRLDGTTLDVGIRRPIARRSAPRPARAGPMPRARFPSSAWSGCWRPARMSSVPPSWARTRRGTSRWPRTWWWASRGTCAVSPIAAFWGLTFGSGRPPPAPSWSGAPRRRSVCPCWSATPMARIGARCAGTAIAGAPIARRSRCA